VAACQGHQNDRNFRPILQPRIYIKNWGNYAVFLSKIPGASGFKEQPQVTNKQHILFGQKRQEVNVLSENLNLVDRLEDQCLKSMILDSNLSQSDQSQPPKPKLHIIITRI